jgi:hypothetical protein
MQKIRVDVAQARKLTVYGVNLRHKIHFLTPNYQGLTLCAQ